MASLPLLNPRIITRLRNLFGMRRTYLDDTAVYPMIQVNDQFDENIKIATASIAPATDDVVIFTTPVDPTTIFYIKDAEITALSGVPNALTWFIDYQPLRELTRRRIMHAAVGLSGITARAIREHVHDLWLPVEPGTEIKLDTVGTNANTVNAMITGRLDKS